MEIDCDRVLGTLPAMVLTALPDGHIDFVNQRWSEYTGLAVEAGHGWEWSAVVDPQDLPKLLARWRSIWRPEARRNGSARASLRRAIAGSSSVQPDVRRCRADRQMAGWARTSKIIGDPRRACGSASDLQSIVDSIHDSVA